MTDVSTNRDDELDLRDAAAVAGLISDLLRRVKDLETAQQLGSSSLGDDDDEDAPTLVEIVDQAVGATIDIDGLNAALEESRLALAENADAVREAAAAAEAAGEVGSSAADIANEAADNALERAQEAKEAAADALTAAENAGGGNAYEDRAPTSDDQTDPDTGKAFKDAALWFVRASTTGIVTGAYQFQQPDPAQPGSWVQITLNNDVIGNLDAGKINAGYLGAERIAAGTITGAKIAADTLTSREIAADAITAAELAADAVIARNIKAGEIQAGHIAALAIDATKIQAGAIIAEKIGAGAITADKIQAGAITADKLSADAINGKTITGVTIVGGTITGARLRTASSGQRVEVRDVANSPYQSGDVAFIDPTGAAKTIRPVAGGIGIGYDEGDYGIRAGILLNTSTGGSIPTPANQAQYPSSSTAYTRNLRVGSSAAIGTVFDPSTGFVLLDDNAWATLSLASAYSGSRGYAVSRIGQIVFLRGQVSRTNGATLTTADTNMFTLPLGFRPDQDMIVNAGGPGGLVPRISIGANGVVGISALPSGYNVSYILLDSIVPYRIN